MFPCMVFDAVCFLNYDVKRSVYWRPDQKAFREKIERLTSGKLYNGYIGMSGLCNKIVLYNKNDKFENYTLDDLARCFNNSDIYEDLLNDQIWVSNSEYSPKEWVERYLYYINVLEEIKFDKLWEDDLLPIIRETINGRQKMYNNHDFDSVFKDIQKLKQCEQLDDVRIYISVMNFPSVFKLYGNNFLDHVGGYKEKINMRLDIVYHELTHGITNNELENLYFEYINSIDYLKNQYDKYVELGYGGGEEEFVCAAEYYLRMKHNGEDKIELVKEARCKNNDCMPTSVFLFDLLSKEAEIPDGYSKWLIDVFKNKRLPQVAIEYNLDHIS